MPRSASLTRTTRAAQLVSVLLVVAALYLARAVLIPVALALLLSFLLAPLVSLVQRARLGRVPSVLVVVALAFTAIGGVGWLVTTQVADLARELPRYRSNIVAKAEALRRPFGVVDEASATVDKLTAALVPASTQEAVPKTRPANAALARPVGADPGPWSEWPWWWPAPPAAGGELKPLPVRVVEPRLSVLDLLRMGLGPLLQPLGLAAVVIVLVIFMLIQREDLRDRLLRLVGHGQVTLTTEALTEASRRVSHYLLAQVALNGGHGIVIGAGLALLGVPNAILWGLLSAILRFIPYVGPWVAALLPVLLSLAVFEGWGRPLGVIALLATVELVSNNLVEPWVYGASTGASAMAIIVSAVFWTWLWGPVGLVLATPLTVCLVVIGKYVPQLDFLTVLLGDERVLPPHVRFYQRLVAMDDLEAQEILEEIAENATPVEIYDQVVVPALALAERDRHSGILPEERAAFILQETRALLEEQAEAARNGQPVNGGAKGVPLTLCVPARDDADALVAFMAGQLLQETGHRVKTLSADMLASELVEQVQGERVDTVCVSALPPSTISQARYLCKRLRRANSDVKIVVGLWNAKVEPSRAAARVGCGGDVTVVTSLAGLLRTIPSRVAGV